MSADPAAAPSGAVTFLFTDVEGSTLRWEADADAMRAALAAHDEVLQRAIKLVVLFDRLGAHEQAATLAGFAVSPLSAAAVHDLGAAIAHLRNVFGDQTYESLARTGGTMSAAEMVAYAYQQIEQARAELNAVSK